MGTQTGNKVGASLGLQTLRCLWGPRRHVKEMAGHRAGPEKEAGAGVRAVAPGEAKPPAWCQVWILQGRGL